jgi:hypothetical protein
MSGEPNSFSWKALILISISMNIFLIAFMLGRFSSSHGKPQQGMHSQSMHMGSIPPQHMPGGMPPHPMPMGGMQQPPMPMDGRPHQSNQRPNQPIPNDDRHHEPRPNDDRQPPMPMGQKPPQSNNRMPNPPPFFGPGDLFNEKEMKEDFAETQKNFEKIQDIRKDFSNKLRKEPVTKDEVLKHFADIDKLMNASRNQMQEKAANKIISMTPEERKHFADKILGGEPMPR